MLDPSVIVAVITLLTVIMGGILHMVSLYLQYHSKQQISQVNDAVNHRHRTGTPRMYDIILENSMMAKRLEDKTDEIINWKNGYSGGPLDEGEKVVKFVEKTNQYFDKLDELEKKCNNDCDSSELGEENND